MRPGERADLARVVDVSHGPGAWLLDAAVVRHQAVGYLRRVARTELPASAGESLAVPHEAERANELGTLDLVAETAAAGGEVDLADEEAVHLADDPPIGGAGDIDVVDVFTVDNDEEYL